MYRELGDVIAEIVEPLIGDKVTPELIVKVSQDVHRRVAEEVLGLDGGQMEKFRMEVDLAGGMMILKALNDFSRGLIGFEEVEVELPVSGSPVDIRKLIEDVLGRPGDIMDIVQDILDEDEDEEDE